MFSILCVINTGGIAGTILSTQRIIANNFQINKYCKFDSLLQNYCQQIKNKFVEQLSKNIFLSIIDADEN